MNWEKAKWFVRTILIKWQYGQVGSHSYIGKPLFIQNKKRLFVGTNVRIYPGMRAEMTTRNASIRIGDNVSIGQNFHVVSYDSELYIGENTTISANVFISNVNHDYHELNVHSLDQKMNVKNTEIGKYSFIGYGAVILPGTKLGKQCIVGANSVVKGKFPDYCVVAGNPARMIRKYNFQTKIWENCSDE